MSKSPKKKDNPYKLLYWMGAGVAALLLGVVLLAVLMPDPEPRVRPDPERTMIWIYDPNDTAAPALIALMEESPSTGTLRAVPFLAPDAIKEAFFARKSSNTAKRELEAYAERKIHKRLFLPYSVVGTLINAVRNGGTVTVDGQPMNGAQAVAYMKEGGEQASERATKVMLALADGFAYQGIDMGVSDGLALARQVDTDISLTNLPTVMGRWQGYATTRVDPPADNAAETLRSHLTPDPSPSAAGQ